MSDRRYLVKEMFGPTLQGEGAHAGTAVVFLRFAACNLECPGCDTDFSPETAVRMTADQIVARLLELDTGTARRVVVTGGEPTLQWDEDLSLAVRGAGFRVHMESNGTRAPQGKVDWLTVSPKSQYHPASIALADDVPASELKLIVDDATNLEWLDKHAARYRCEHYFLQPWMDGHYDAHLQKAIALIHQRPQWRLSLQTHKIINVP